MFLALLAVSSIYEYSEPSWIAINGWITRLLNSAEHVGHIVSELFSRVLGRLKTSIFQATFDLILPVSILLVNGWRSLLDLLVLFDSLITVGVNLWNQEVQCEPSAFIRSEARLVIGNKHFEKFVIANLEEFWPGKKCLYHVTALSGVRRLIFWACGFDLDASSGCFALCHNFFILNKFIPIIIIN